MLQAASRKQVTSFSFMCNTAMNNLTSHIEERDLGFRTVRLCSTYSCSFKQPFKHTTKKQGYKHNTKQLEMGMWRWWGGDIMEECLRVNGRQPFVWVGCLCEWPRSRKVWEFNDNGRQIICQRGIQEETGRLNDGWSNKNTKSVSLETTHKPGSDWCVMKVFKMCVCKWEVVASWKMVLKIMYTPWNKGL